MRMEIITAILCIHMLLWAGCDASPSAHTLGSLDKTLLRRAQLGKVLSRKLLEENTWKQPDVGTGETTDASFQTDPISVDQIHVRPEDAKRVDVKEIAVPDAKIETANLVSTSWTAQQEGTMALPMRIDNDATKEEGIKSEEAPKEENHTEWNAVDRKEASNYTPETEKKENTEDFTTQAIAQSQAEEKPTPDVKVSEQGAKPWESAQQALPQKVEEEKSWQTEEKRDQTAVTEKAWSNQEGSHVDTQNKRQRDVTEESVEESKKDSAPEQKDASVEEGKKDSTLQWQDVRIAEDKKDSGAVEQKDATVEDAKRDSVPEQKVAEVEEDEKDRASVLKDANVVEDKTDSPSEQKDAKVEVDKKDSVPEHKDVMPGDEKRPRNDRQEILIAESGSGVQSTEIKEGHTEDNPIQMVETDSGEKHRDFSTDAKIEMMHNSEEEGGNKGQAALESPPASTEEHASSDSSNGKNSTPSDTKVEDLKLEENNQARNEYNTWKPLQEQSNESREEKRDKSNGEEVPQERSNESGEEKHEENQGEVSPQEKGDERGEEKRGENNSGDVPQEKNGERGDEKWEESNVAEVSQEKSEAEKRDLSNENTELRHEESEKPKAEEVPQWKSEEKAEAIMTENREVATEDNNTEVKDKEAERSEGEEVSQVKADDETQAAAKEVESQLEAFKRDTVFDTTNDQRQESSIDPSDDEYDIIQELADLPTNIQETAGRVAEHIRPDLVRWTDTSKVYFNLANQQISESFSPLIGKEYAPFFASMISYGILLLPLLVVILLFDHIKALFSLQKVLLFINIYLAAYFATLWLASFIIGLEPMSFFYHNSLSSYLSLQILQALGYVVYLILQTANMINSCSSETPVGKVTSTLQWIVAMGIGLHYYVTVFHPAVASKPPHTSWKFYAIYSAAFFILCLFARIRWVKKRYVSAGNDMANKKS